MSKGKPRYRNDDENNKTTDAIVCKGEIYHLMSKLTAQYGEAAWDGLAAAHREHLLFLGSNLNEEVKKNND